MHSNTNHFFPFIAANSHGPVEQTHTPHTYATRTHTPVSYTHLDVYKRQVIITCSSFKIVGGIYSLVYTDMLGMEKFHL